MAATRTDSRQARQLWFIGPFRKSRRPPQRANNRYVAKCGIHTQHLWRNRLSGPVSAKWRCSRQLQSARRALE